MKIDFPFANNQTTNYCIHCKKELPMEIKKDNEENILCPHCNQSGARSIIIDPKLKWWLDDEKVYHHASVGIMIINSKQEILFFELTKYPFGLTMPAGHIDASEEPYESAVREAFEETGLKVRELNLVLNTRISGDQCRRGSDDHDWTLYSYHITDEEIKHITIDKNEGTRATWLSYSQIISSLYEMPFAMQTIFKDYFVAIKKVLDSQENM